MAHMRKGQSAGEGNAALRRVAGDAPSYLLEQKGGGRVLKSEKELKEKS